MSRIGKLPVTIPETVEVSASNGVIIVKGPKGELKREFPRDIKIELKENEVLVAPKGESKTARAMHGTWRALIANMVKGVLEGWSKQLELVGTGYRAEGSENNLVLAIGYSHPVEMKAPEGIKFNIQKTLITIEGIDKELVGQVAAKIRDIRPPEPYKGKGIKYIDEVVRRKPGKAAKAQGAAA